MLVLMKNGASTTEIFRVKEKVIALGYQPHEIPGATRVAIGITGNKGKINPDLFSTMPGVEEAIPVTKPYKLVGRDAVERELRDRRRWGDCWRQGACHHRRPLLCGERGSAVPRG